MKAERKPSSKPGTSFIVGFVWLSFLFGLVSILGCDLRLGGNVLMHGPGAADAIEYAEARQEAMNDPEVIDADRRYKKAYHQWLAAHEKLREIAKKAGPFETRIPNEYPHVYGSADRPEYPEKPSWTEDEEKHSQEWDHWLGVWIKKKNEKDRLLDEYEELVDRKAEEIIKASSAKAKRRETEPAGGAGGGGGHCFPADTFVFLNGEVKRITEVEVGDQVMSKNVTTGKDSSSTVLKVYDFCADHHYLLNGKIKATGGESFYTPDGWKRTSDLKVGERIHTLSGATEEILSKERISENLRVYNIKVDRNHTFFVSPDGETGYLVHNK